MKQILILGTGNAQLDAILYLKEKGYTVHGASYRKEGPCLQYLDYFELLNICDADRITEYADKHSIDAVYSVGSDLAMPAACIVSERLGLPKFVSANTAIVCNNKALLRNEFGVDFNGNIRYRILDSPEQIKDWNYWPFMMKPVDSQGQRGVRKIESMDHFEEYFYQSLSYSRSGKLICEEYIDGPEISVNCFVKDGDLIYCRTSDRIVFNDLPGGIIHRHVLPSRIMTEKQDTEVRQMVIEILKKLKITDGPAYMQIKMSQNGPKLVEATPRLDGCHMWRLIKEAEGVDLLDMTFRLLLDNSADVIHPVRPIWHELEFLCREPGCVMDRSRFQTNGAKYLCWYYENGEIIRPINGFMEKAGYLIRKIYD